MTCDLSRWTRAWNLDQQQRRPPRRHHYYHQPHKNGTVLWCTGTFECPVKLFSHHSDRLQWRHQRIREDVTNPSSALTSTGDATNGCPRNNGQAAFFHQLFNQLSNSCHGAWNFTAFAGLPSGIVNCFASCFTVATLFAEWHFLSTWLCRGLPMLDH